MANTSTAGTGGSAKPTKTEQNLFEEDDEFEEFPAEGKGGRLGGLLAEESFVQFGVISFLLRVGCTW